MAAKNWWCHFKLSRKGR